MNAIINESKAIEDKLIRMRRDLHKIPEFGSELPETRKYVCARLDELGIPYRLNAGDDGLVAEICGGEGRIIAFRADMDALHVDEVDRPGRSEIEGQMHGCGHDAHTAMLLAAAEVINNHKDELNGTVRLIFQAAEEIGKGAIQMIEEGALTGVDSICGIHVGNLAGDDFPAGTFVIVPGPASAGKDKFNITITGKGTHTAFPEKGIDSISIGAKVVNAYEEIMAKELPAGTAAVLAFGSFQAGIDNNSIPQTAILRGSLRAQDDSVRDFVGKRMKEVADGIAKAFRAECDVEIKRGSYAVINDTGLSTLVADSVAELLGADKVVTKTPSALMGSDDFFRYASKVPGVYFFLCTNNADKGITSANHHPAFDVDEDVLWEGVAAYTAVALKYLG